MTCYVAFAGWPWIVPARRIEGMKTMPLLPCLLEFTLGCKDDEVHVADAVRLASGKRADETTPTNGGLAAASASSRIRGHWRRRSAAVCPGQSLIGATMRHPRAARGALHLRRR